MTESAYSLYLSGVVDNILSIVSKSNSSLLNFSDFQFAYRFYKYPLESGFLGFLLPFIFTSLSIDTMLT